jgi:hypothetical protein
MNIRILVAILLVLLSTALASAQSPSQDPVRSLADIVAGHVATNNADAVYKEMSPKVKKAYTRDELVTPLALMRAAYGNIVSYQLKATQPGKRLVAGEWLSTVTYWYPVVTDKYPTGRFLKVEITAEGGRFYLAGYSVIQFLGSKAPPFLQ